MDDPVAHLQAGLAAVLAAEDPAARALCVAFSGGLDSTVLLHAAAALRDRRPGFAVRALHVDHGLHAAAGDWARHCRAVAAALGVACEVRAVRVEPAAGGPEAGARTARYAALAAALAPGERLLTAHHRGDQVETLLLRLLRGAGPTGLAGIAPRRPFARGWLLRPWLGVDRSRIAAYARAAGLDWIEDPSNADPGPERNYLRLHVLPGLRARWPGLDATLARAAGQQAEAAALLDALAAQDAAGAAADDRLALARLTALDPARRRNLVRAFLRARGLPMPSAARLEAGLTQLLQAEPDRAPRLAWPAGELRRFAGWIYLRRADDLGPPPSAPIDWSPTTVLELGPPRGRLALAPGRPGVAGLAPDRVAAALGVRFRTGGERLRPHGAAHHVPLKKLFQQARIVPWMRGQVPLVYTGETLVAVADLWIAAEASADGGPRITWSGHAALR